jgi:hypothetical protein
MSYTYIGTKGCGKVLDVESYYSPGIAAINPVLCGMIVPMPDPIIGDELTLEPAFCKACEILETEYLIQKLRANLGL